MLRSLPSLTRIVCLLAVLLSATGCSSDRIAGWLITRKLDEYFDLNRDQEKRVRPRVDEGLAAVRRDTLPAWIGLLREARDRMATPATDAQLTHLQDRFDEVLDGAVAQIIPRISPVLADLSDAQVDHFVGKLRKLNDKNFEEQRVVPEQRQKKLDDHVIEGIEELIGDVSDAQRAHILTTFHALPDDRAAQYKLNRRELDDFQKLLKTHPGEAAIAADPDPGSGLDGLPHGSLAGALYFAGDPTGVTLAAAAPG